MLVKCSGYIYASFIIYLICPLMQDVTQGLFFNVEVPARIHMGQAQKLPSNRNHCHANIDIIIISPLLVQLRRCSHKIRNPKTRCLLLSQMRREQILCFDHGWKAEKVFIDRLWHMVFFNCQVTTTTVIKVWILHWPHLCNEKGAVTELECLGTGKFTNLKWENKYYALILPKSLSIDFQLIYPY